MTKKTYNDEIDISEIILNLWENKIKIIGITTAFLILGFLYFNSLAKNFIVTTNIKPISTFESDKYKLYNSFAREGVGGEGVGGEGVGGEGVVNINQETLLDLFIQKIKTTEIIEDGIIKNKLVIKDNFKTE